MHPPMQDEVIIDPTVFITHPLPNGGYKWTLASRLGQMLNYIEAMYGPRDTRYTLLGYEFVTDHPRIWYPGNQKHIIVQLGLSALGNEIQACYQLAHECIHLLCPSGGIKANNLEEGLATYFAAWYVMKTFGLLMVSTGSSYVAAQRDVEILLGIDKNAILTLRKEEPDMVKFTKALILKHYPIVGEELAIRLTDRFERGE